MPKTREELEAYYNKIDNNISMNELRALIKRTFQYLSYDDVFINKIRDLLSKYKILRKSQFDELWKAIQNEENLKNKKSKRDLDSFKKIEKIPENYRKSIENFLEDEYKFEIIKEILNFRIVREDKNKVLVFLLLSGAYSNNYQIILAIGESTGGKSHIADNVIELFPENHIYTITGASDKALIYKEWNEEKILNIPEAQRNPVIVESLKDFGDKGIVYDTVERNEENRFETRNIIIGKKSVIITTTVDKLNSQLENRAWKIEPDLSRSQSKIIVNTTIERKKNVIKSIEISSKINELEKLLKFSIYIFQNEYKFDFIEIPYADVILPLFNYNFTKIRRDHKKFLSLIEIITSWNYKIREYYEVSDFKVLLAHPNDLINAFEEGEEIFMNLTQNLSPEKRKILSYFQEIVNEKSQKERKTLLKQLDIKGDKNWFKTNEIYDFYYTKESVKKSKKTFRNLLNSLNEDGYLDRYKKGRDNVYRLRESNSMRALDIKERINIFNDSFELYEKRKRELQEDENIIFQEREIDPILKIEPFNIEIYKKIVEIFKENDTNELDIDFIIQKLSFGNDSGYSEEKINIDISIMLKSRIFKKNFDNKLIYKK